MARQVIDIDTDHGTYKGDPAKVAFGKANDNFAELYGFGQADGSNLLINPELRINQRVFAGGALAANTYGYDRWKAGSSACNVTANNGVITHASGPLVQVLENPGLASTQVTMSVLSPSAALNVSIGGVTETIAAGTGRRSATVTLPAGATGNVIVQITATNASYRQLKLEVGAAVTPFAARPWAMEVAMCQRYCRKFAFEAGSAFTMALVLDASTGIGWLDFPTMRVIPTARIIGGLQMTGGGPVSSPAAPTLLPSSPENMAMLLVVQGKTPGAAGYFNPSAGGATIFLEAEL